VDQVVSDLHRSRPLAPACLDSHLQRDLGLDSLAMAEVLVSLEEAFGVSLPSALLASAESPADLLRAVVSAGGRGVRRPPPRSWATSTHPAETHAPEPQVPGPPELGAGVPADAKTLVDVLDWHCATHPDRVHLRLLGEAGPENPEETLTFAELHREATAVAQGLIAAEVSPGDSVALMLPTGRSYFQAFMGVVLAGGVPVPIYPPARPSQIEDHLRRQANVLSNAGAVALLTVDEARSAARLLRSSVDTLRRIATVDELAASTGREPLPRLEPGATALIQYTSGSTGQPKGVVLSHANVLANIRAMGQAAEVAPSDVFVSWLPLYHDMGLIGAWLGSLCLDMTAVVMSPVAFLARPARWLEAIDVYRGTLTAAPNFAYELCLGKVTDAEAGSLDLSSLRMALNGAEPVVAETMERFRDRFARCGLKPGALAPVYGLAECAVGLAFPPPGRDLLIDTVAAASLRREARAVPAGPGQADTVRIVGCGRPLPGYLIRVVDEAGRELGERAEGHLEFCGPSATAGYNRNPAATAALLHDGWLRTGDLGYIADGDLFITGRSKDVIIKAGRNLHPEQLETAVGELPGVRKGCVAAFAARDKQAATEKLVVLAETRESELKTRERIRAQIVATTVDLLGTPPDDVVLAPPGTVFKTSSGKIRRAACADMYERGAIGARARSAWWQLIRFGWSSVPARLRSRRREMSALAYAAYCWVIIGAVGVLLMALVAVVPRQSWRQRLVRAAARGLVKLSGTGLEIDGAEHLATGGRRVVVANHESWLDSVVLAAWLPSSFTFVAGDVFRGQRVAGFLLKRIGAEFVGASEAGQPVADTARLAQLARERSLVIFPEGGLSRVPGLRPFHPGAFVAATEARCLVVPVAIRGTRSMLRPGHRFVRRGAVSLLVGKPIAPSADGWRGAAQLEREARAVILSNCGEPEVSPGPP